MHPKTPQLLLFLAAVVAAGEAAATTFTVTPEKLGLSDREITIRWSNLPAPDALDYVAIYSPPSSRDSDFLGYLFLNGSASWSSGHGELTLPRLPNLRAPYQFRLFRWPAKEYSYHHVDLDGNPLPHGRHRVAVSGEVAFADSARPEQVHLAFADGVDEMRVLFVCGDGGKRTVRYWLGKEDEKDWKEVGTEVRTYEQKHMCDWPANDSVAWRDPGFVFDGVMKGLEPGRRYFYKVGSDLAGWSETYSYISRDSEADETEQVHLAFADGVDEMRVLFVCGDGGKRTVRYGLGKEAATMTTTNNRASYTLAASIVDEEEATMKARHEEWMVQHGRTYKDEAEKVRRFQVFKANVEYIDRFNAAPNKKYRLGTNKFTDLTDDEFMTKYTGGYKPKSSLGAHKLPGFMNENHGRS